MSGMEITLKSESTTRTVELTVSGVEPMRKQYSKWIFRPDLLTVFYRDGKLDGAEVSGPRVLKNGDSELERGSYKWYTAQSVEADAPEWIRDAVAWHADGRVAKI